jgi:uncharacterized OB-fold protein
VTNELVAQRTVVPRAEPTPVSQPFWEGCARGELLFQRCRACSAITFPASEVCRMCLSQDLDWQRSSGSGVLYSWTVVWRPATPAFTTPYAPAIVALDEGFQMLSNVIDADVEQLAVDLPLQVTFRLVGDVHLAYFAPVPPTVPDRSRR